METASRSCSAARAEAKSRKATSAARSGAALPIGYIGLLRRTHQTTGAVFLLHPVGYREVVSGSLTSGNRRLDMIVHCVQRSTDDRDRGVTVPHTCARRGESSPQRPNAASERGPVRWRTSDMASGCGAACGRPDEFERGRAHGPSHLVGPPPGRLTCAGEVLCRASARSASASSAAARTSGSGNIVGRGTRCCSSSRSWRS